MKNILFFIGISLIIISCNQSNAKITSALVQKKVPMTLNGFDSTTADKMVRRFLKKKGVYNHAARTSIWFSINYLDSLLAMLDKEHAEDVASGKTEKADGVRIYFAKESKGKFGFIIVSTRGKNQNPKSAQTDYFYHDPQFLPIATGEIDRGGNSRGAVLNRSKFPCQTSNCSTSGNHYVDCIHANDWITNDTTKNSKDTINTTSEWFELSLLHEIRNDLKVGSKKRKPDGIRIYYARKKEPNTKFGRHHFIIATTESVTDPEDTKKVIHQDYFDCPSSKFVSLNDNGEQCLSNCVGTTWND